jgi:hypothetical protein
MSAAGLNAKALQTLVGDSSITVTLDATAVSSRAPKERLPSCSTPISRRPMTAP